MLLLPTGSPDGLYESVATPLAFVAAVPTVPAFTEKVTVTPDTAVPPTVCVSVALSDTGPFEPYPIDTGVGAPTASVVASVPPLTASEPVVVRSPLPWQFAPRAAVTVNV